MPTEDQENQQIAESFEKKEAGIADLMDFYEKVEGVYAQASSYTYQPPASYVSDSTNVAVNDAHLG